VVHCTDQKDQALDLVLSIDGETATGMYSLPSRPPKALVVMAHGYGHISASWARHMRRVSEKHGVIAVAMDYRGIAISPDSNGDGLPESRGWNVMKGAEDSIAAAQLFQRACRSIGTTVMFSVSMGSNTGGLALALSEELRRADGAPLFDYWVNVEGAVNMIETYLGARVLAPANGTAANAKADIEAETGGTFEQKPDAYRERAVVTRVDDIKASGVKGVVSIHGLDDGLVPYNQAREIHGLLRGAGIPTHLWTVGRKSPESEKETTITGYPLGAIDPNYRSPLAGHASEKSETHIIMVTAFERLAEILGDGFSGDYREGFIDGEAGSLSTP
jgi:pimeloyl-ACP methyl ester carboxylesterase